MFVLEVAQLMSQHRIDFTGVQLLEQRVVKHHALGRAEAGEIGVGMCRAFAAVHHKQALGGKAAALHQGRDTRLQGFVLQRFELVEERGNHGGVKHQHQKVKAHPRAPGPQPPQAAGTAHQPQDQGHDGQAYDGAHQNAFDHIGQPEPESHFVEAEALFNTEGAVQRERQVQRAADDAERREQRQLRHQAAVCREA
ncbi:hypothetical protein D9M73_50000 [compost metagenome]